MSDRALMQQALEALEMEATRTPIPETAAAMAALRARLAEPEPEPVAWRYWKDKFACWEYSDMRVEFPAVPAGTEMHPLYTAPPARRSEPEPEPVALKWSPAPRKTEWGFGMVCADVEIDRDHTLTLYCEEDQTAKVDAMLSPTRRLLTDEEIDRITRDKWGDMLFSDVMEVHREFARAIERKITGGNDE